MNDGSPPGGAGREKGRGAGEALETGGQPGLPRIVSSGGEAVPLGAMPALRPRVVEPDVLGGFLPGAGRKRLARGEVLVVTTGQQPGLFLGPLYTVYKALSAMALARRLERERGVPVVPVFWVAGDDHDFAEANHAWYLDAEGDAARVVLRERPSDDPLRPLWREPCADDAPKALAALDAGMPDSEFKLGVFDWLGSAYRPEANLADAFAVALNALLGPRGLAVFCAHASTPKRAMMPWVLAGLDVTLDDGLTPVLVEGTAGRDRLEARQGAFVARRSGERFSRDDLARIAAETPTRLSPNVMLRPVIEAALLPTVAYAAGPAELEYLPQARPVYGALGTPVEPQLPVPRWSGTLVERRVDKVLERYALAIDAFAPPVGRLEGALVRDALPGEVTDALAALSGGIESGYGRLAEVVAGIDRTLTRTVHSARNAALSGTHEIEKKLIAARKRADETLLGRIAKARAALYPAGQPQERVLSLPSFLIRYGPALVGALEEEVARWAAAS